MPAGSAAIARTRPVRRARLSAHSRPSAALWAKSENGRRRSRPAVSVGENARNSALCAGVRAVSRRGVIAFAHCQDEGEEMQEPLAIWKTDAEQMMWEIPKVGDCCGDS